MDNMNEEIQAYKDKRIREVAYEHRLPFQLKELSKRAEQGVREAQRTRGRKVYQEEVLQHFKDCINDALMDAIANGSLREEVKIGERPLTEERIREALEAFPTQKQWKHLLEGCEYNEAWTLKVFLNANRDEFEQSLGKKNLQSIEIHAMERRLVLWGQEGAKVINTSAPYWAAVFWRRAREENVSGVKPGPHDRRTVPERAADPRPTVGGSRSPPELPCEEARRKAGREGSLRTPLRSRGNTGRGGTRDLPRRRC